MHSPVIPGLSFAEIMTNDKKGPWYQQKGTDVVSLVLFLAALLVLAGLIVLVSF